MKYFNTKILTLFIVIVGSLVCLNSFAQDVAFKATVDRKEATLWDTINLSLVLSGGSKLPQDFVLPTIEGFNSSYVGQSSSMTIINGAYSSSTTYSFTLYPLQQGSFLIPSIGVRIKGDIYTSDPIELKVIEAAEPEKQQAPGAPAKLEDKIFMTFESSKTDVYINEEFTLTIRLYSRDISLGDIQMPIFNDQHLVTKEFEKPRQFQEIFGGLESDVIEFKINAYAPQPGKMSVGPVMIGCNVLYQKTAGRNVSHGGLFSDPFFNSIFDRVEKMPIQVKSRDLSINVSSLPPQKDDELFSGGVGNYSFEMLASPTEVKVGDPITVTMNVHGTDILETVKMPVLENSDDFKVYEPQIKERDGEKTLEQVLIPLHEKVDAIPEVKFIYFSPTSKRYEVISEGKIPIKVEKLDGEDGFRVFDVSLQNKIEGLRESIGRDIIYIKDLPGQIRVEEKWLYQSFIFKLWFILLTIVYAGLFIFYEHHKKVRTDIAYARNFNAAKKARDRLKVAKKLQHEESIVPFYEALSKTIREYIGDKFHIPAGGLTPQDLGRICAEKNIPSEIAQQLISVLEKCDQVKFASGKQDSQESRTYLIICEKIISAFERSAKL